jgi:hypothetical protein
VASAVTKRNSTLVERFMEKVIPEPNSGCWLWMGAANPAGYGNMKLGPKKWDKAHRVSYRIHHGEPNGVVCHRCDVPSCVNPDHLWLGTHADNQRDCVNKGRANKSRGEQHFRVRITDEQVAAIRADTRSTRLIAMDYGIGSRCVRAYKNRERR